MFPPDELNGQYLLYRRNSYTLVGKRLWQTVQNTVLLRAVLLYKSDYIRFESSRVTVTRHLPCMHVHILPPLIRTRCTTFMYLYVLCSYNYPRLAHHLLNIQTGESFVMARVWNPGREGGCTPPETLTIGVCR